MSRGRTSVGIDVRAKSVIVATLKRDGRKTALTDIQVIDTPQLLERGMYRDTHHIIEAINTAIEGHITGSPALALGAVRSRTFMTTIPLRGLNRQKAAQVINAQAAKHFPNPGEHTIAVDTARLPTRARRGKGPEGDWLAAATPNDHLKAIAEVEEGISRPIDRVEPKAIATLRAARAQITQPGNHLVLGGGDDGADLTILVDGVVHLVRLLGPDLERDIIPELARTLDYLRSEGHETPTLHLATQQEHAKRLTEALEVDTLPITPWDELAIDDELHLDPNDMQAAVTAIGLALGALDPTSPDLNLKPSGKRAKATRAVAPRGNTVQAASLALILAAGAYHYLATQTVNGLRDEVRALETQLLSGGTPERRRVEQLQVAIDEILRHEALVLDLTTRRLKPTEHIQRVITALPSSSKAATGQGLRFQTLNLRAATEAPAAHQPLPPEALPATLITITGVAPDTLTLEDDMRVLEQDPYLRGYVRYTNRTHAEDVSDASVNTQIEVLTLHEPITTHATESLANLTPLPVEEQP